MLSLARGVYAPAALVAEAARDQTRQQALRLAAALARSRGQAAGSHECAAVIHGLETLRRSSGGLVVTRPPGTGGSRTGPPGVRVYAAALPSGHVSVRHGVPVTSVARTVVDLARTSSFRVGVVAADSALRGGQSSKADLRSVIAECGRWPGIQRAKRVVAFGDARSESVFESISRVAFHEHGLPPPELQVWVGDDDGIVGRVDFLWKAHRTIAEADGAVKYTEPKRALVQLQRDARLREAGFEVVHFTWRQIVLVPGQVAEAIRTAFARSTSG